MRSGGAVIVAWQFKSASVSNGVKRQRVIVLRARWRREFFQLAGFMIGCKMRANGGTVEGDSDPRCAHVLHGSDMIGCQIGELDYGAEMHLVMKEAGMLPAQRLARCAGRLLKR
jgi:hypothetical protein